MIVVGVFLTVLWLAVALRCSGDVKPPRKYPGCCNDCGHGRCTFHPLCADCSEPTYRRHLPLPPPTDEERLYRD